MADEAQRSYVDPFRGEDYNKVARERDQYAAELEDARRELAAGGKNLARAEAAYHSAIDELKSARFQLENAEEQLAMLRSQGRPWHGEDRGYQTPHSHTMALAKGAMVVMAWSAIAFVGLTVLIGLLSRYASPQYTHQDDALILLKIRFNEGGSE